MKSIHSMRSALIALSVLAAVGAGPVRADAPFGWGYNSLSQLGCGTDTSNFLLPVQMVNVTRVAAMAGGYSHGIAMTPEGVVYCWGGYDSYGQTGPVDFGAFPGIVKLPLPALSVAAGLNHSLAVLSDGSVWGWGNDQQGQLGDATFHWQYNYAFDPSQALIANVVAVAGGDNHSLFLKSDGTVWAAGYNQHGQLGNGTTTDSNSPVQVQGLPSNIVSISAGAQFSAAVAADGAVYTWGENQYGQLGNDSTADSATPVAVTGLPGPAIGVSAGGYHTEVALSDGTVWGWGWNSNGQLADGTTVDRHTPVQAAGMANVTAVSCGGYHTLALCSDGTLWAWGLNYDGQLGNGTRTSSSAPIQVQGLSTVGLAAAAGYTFSFGYEQAKPEPTSMTTSKVSGRVGSHVTLSGKIVRTKSKRALAGKTIEFLVDGVPVAANLLTDKTGAASASYTIPESLGTGSHTITARFAGNNSVAPAVQSTAPQIVKDAVAIAVPNSSGARNTTVVIHATLKTAAGAPIVGRTIAFKVGARSGGSGVTDANGEATVSFKIAKTATLGSTPIAATFAGDAYYLKGAGAGTLTVN